MFLVLVILLSLRAVSGESYTSFPFVNFERSFRSVIAYPHHNIVSTFAQRQTGVRTNGVSPAPLVFGLSFTLASAVQCNVC